ncbi:MAG: hypothetical protein IJ438_05115 [Clostridia bacterium]|nr:hypothetical protein [Clostridia bacterium]
MAVAIKTEDVRRALAPMLGQRLVAETPLCDHAAELLRRYDPARTTLEELASHVKDAIFGDLYTLLGPRMTLALENGVMIRVRLEDIDTLTDTAMGVLLAALQPPVLTLEGLRAYAMSSGSVSAMRVMLQRYHKVLSKAERDMMQRIIGENQ